MKSRITIIAVAALLVVLVGCGGGAKSAPTTVPAADGGLLPSTGSSGSTQLVVRGGPVGTMASASAHTSAGTLCSIAYTHPSGKPSTAQGLDPKTAGPDGNATWSWLISPSTQLGSGEVAVTCGGDQATAAIIVGPAPVLVGDGKLAVVGAAAGSVASATMRSSPGAVCSISYTHPSGKASVAQGLDPQTVGADGRVSWSWVISPSTTPGAGTVAVTCGSDQASAPIEITPAQSP